MQTCKRRRVREQSYRQIESNRSAAMTKTKPSDDKVNMQELVGNTDGFAESGYVSPTMLLTAPY